MCTGPFQNPPHRQCYVSASLSSALGAIGDARASLPDQNQISNAKTASAVFWLSVPEVTLSANIKLNERVSLRRHTNWLWVLLPETITSLFSVVMNPETVRCDNRQQTGRQEQNHDGQKTSDTKAEDGDPQVFSATSDHSKREIASPLRGIASPSTGRSSG